MLVSDRNCDNGVSLDAVLTFIQAIKNSTTFRYDGTEDDFANVVCKNEDCNCLEGWPRSENGYRAATRYVNGGRCHACKNTGA